MPPKAKQEKLVTLTLAHPLSAQYAVRLGLDDEDYDLGAEVKVSRGNAQALIGAGYAEGIDPEQREDVAKVLDVDVSEVPSTSTSTTGTPSV